MDKLDKSPYISLNGGWKGLGDSFNYASPFDLKKSAENAGYKLLFGVQTSEKTQVFETENKYGDSWYPVGTNLNNAMDLSGSSVIHMNFGTTSPDSIALFAKLVVNNARGNGISYAQKSAGGIQFNRLPWHDTNYISAFEKLLKAVPVSRYILQASDMQIEKLTPSEFAKTISLYSPYISTVLLDESSGTGKPLDPQTLRPFIDALYCQTDMPSVAVAGGLSPANVGFKLEGLLADYPGLSVDVETGLRDNYDKNNPKQSTFSSKKARDFVSKIIELSS